MKEFIKKVIVTAAVIVFASAMVSLGIVGWLLSVNEDAGAAENEAMIFPVMLLIFVICVIVFSMYAVSKYTDKQSNGSSVYYGFASVYQPRKKKNPSYTFLAILRRRIRRKIKEKKAEAKNYVPRHLSASSFDLPL